MGANVVPWLRSGVGDKPGDGGCIMQVIDWIHREMWTDDPPCVHPVIRSLAIRVNDNADDRERQKLLDLAPRMMNTAGGDVFLTRLLLAHLARQVYPIWETWIKESGYDDSGVVLACIEAAEQNGAAAEAAWAAGATKAAWAAGAAWAAEAAWAAWAAKAAWAAGAAWAAEAAEAAWAVVPTPMELLVEVLDRYDELTGRDEFKDLDFAPVVSVMAAK